VALVYPKLQEGRISLVVLDLESLESTTALSSLEASRLAQIAWVPDHAEPVVQELGIEPAEPSVRWGGQVTLAAQGTFSDGTMQALPVEWEALDPNRASVNAQGVVTGNQAGSALIVAHYGPWMDDTVAVEVFEYERPDVALQGDFGAEQLSRWEPFGFPPSRIAAVDGDTVLSLEGDGAWNDGVRSRESFSLDDGARVEVVFRLGLTRSDRQRIALCIQPAEIELPSGDLAYLGTRRDQAYCLQYPAREQVKFDPLDSSITYYTLGSEDFVRLPEDFDPSQWTQFALEIQPDGQAGLYVNQELLQALPTPVIMTPGRLWRILLIGASADTYLHVRSVTVYSGTSAAAAPIAHEPMRPGA
jgi:hypothetical protein